jgi:hypothetical protein
MSGRRPLINGDFATLRLIVGAVMRQRRRQNVLDRGVIVYRSG